MSTRPMEDVLLGPPVAAREPAWRSRWLQLRERVSGNLSYALADQVVYSFGNMVVAALVNRHCGQQQFGIYILTQRAMDVLIQLSNVSLWGPFTFNLPATPKERHKEYQGSIFALQIILCAVSTILLLLLAVWAHHAREGVYFGTFWPLVLTGGGILFREFNRRMYFSHVRLQAAFWTDAVTVFLQVAAVWVLAATGRLTVYSALLALFGGAAVVSVWWVWQEWQNLTINLRVMVADLSQNMKLGRWFFGSNMVFLASSQCNPWVLSAMLGGGAVGAYAVCESVVNIPRVGLTSMQNIMGPMAARAHKDGGTPALLAVVARLDRMLLLGSAVFAAGFIFVGPLVSRLIFKSVPGNSRAILLVLSLNLVAYAATLAQSYGLTAMNRAHLTFYANTLGLLAQAAVCVLLVHKFHVPGAAAAMLVGSLVVLVVRQRFFVRETRSA